MSLERTSSEFSRSVVWIQKLTIFIYLLLSKIEENWRKLKECQIRTHSSLFVCKHLSRSFDLPSSSMPGEHFICAFVFHTLKLLHGKIISASFYLSQDLIHRGGTSEHPKVRLKHGDLIASEDVQWYLLVNQTKWTLIKLHRHYLERWNVVCYLHAATLKLSLPSILHLS